MRSYPKGYGDVGEKTIWVLLGFAVPIVEYGPSTSTSKCIRLTMRAGNGIRDKVYRFQAERCF